jgi:hypothetical protein
LKFLEHKQELAKFWLSFVWSQREPSWWFYTRQNNDKSHSKRLTTSEETGRWPEPFPFQDNQFL